MSDADHATFLSNLTQFTFGVNQALAVGIQGIPIGGFVHYRMAGSKSFPLKGFGLSGL